MDQQTLLMVMTAFVVIAAIARDSSGMLFGIYKSSRALEEKATPYAKWKPWWRRPSRRSKTAPADRRYHDQDQ